MEMELTGARLNMRLNALESPFFYTDSLRCAEFVRSLVRVRISSFFV